MNSFFTRTLPDFLRDVVGRHAPWTIALTLIITCGFIWALTTLRFENVPGKLDLPLDDPVRIEREQFEVRFGGGESILIALEFDRPIDAAAVRLIDRLSDSYAQVEGVVSVYSITTAAELSWAPTLGVQVLRPGPVVRVSSGVSDSALVQSIDELRRHSLHRENLISQDGHTTVIILSVDPQTTTGLGGLEALKVLVESLKRITADAIDRSIAVSYAGTPVLNIALQTAMRRDLSIFGPLSLVAFVIVLIIIFRSWQPVVASLITALLALIWSVGLLPLTGTPMSLGLSMIIPLVLALSLVYSIHHVACVCRSEGNLNGEPRIAGCWQLVVVPNFLCGVTTCVGFLSLAISQLPGIREVGVFVGCGVIFSTLLANLFLPAMLTTLTPKAGWKQGNISERFVARSIPKLQRTILHHPFLFVIVIVAITIMAGLGMRQLKVETNHLAYLAKDKEVTESFGLINTEFGGVLPLEIIIDVPRRDAAAVIPLIVNIEDSLRALDGLGSAISAADFIMRAEQSKPQTTVPLRPPLHLDKGFLPAQIWDLVGGATVSGRFADQTDTIVTMRIGCRVHTTGSEQLRLLLTQVRGLLKRHFSAYRTTVTGLAAYFARVEEYVISTQIESFAVALAVVIILLAAISASMRTGLAVIAVNVLPVVIVLGIMGWLAVPLDISTVMIAAIAVGIVVDDTIHLLYSFKRERQKGKAVEVSLRQAFSEVGLPVLTTTIVLTIGFGSLLPARFLPTAYFGGLSALTVLVAAVADMLLLPALIIIVHRSSGNGADNNRS